MAYSIEHFAQELIDDDRSSFSFDEAREFASILHRSTGKIIKELKDYGFHYEGRPVAKEVRGFTANPHNRWEGNPCAGGSAWEQIFGFAGKEG
jgi:hypothetical protein